VGIGRPFAVALPPKCDSSALRHEPNKRGTYTAQRGR
jgi:hypothetical protein